jgi:stalled ribosome alternative rescue factor ArfA
VLQKKPNERIPLDLIFRQLQEIRDKDKGFFIRKEKETGQIDLPGIF